LLDLDVLAQADPPRIRINGTVHTMRHPDEFSVLDFHRILPKRVYELELLEKPTEAEAQEYRERIDAACRQVLVASEDVQATLTFKQRNEVVKVFMRLWLTGNAPAAGATPAAAAATEAERGVGPKAQPTGAN
jgi:hypothetical protein